MSEDHIPRQSNVISPEATAASLAAATVFIETILKSEHQMITANLDPTLQAFSLANSCGQLLLAALVTKAGLNVSGGPSISGLACGMTCAVYQHAGDRTADIVTGLLASGVGEGLARARFLFSPASGSDKN